MTDTPINKGGRPKGSKDTKPRRMANGWVLPKDVIAQAKRDLVTLGPDGRSFDEIGILRACSIAVLSIAVREIEKTDPIYLDRRRTLTALFDSIHRALGRALEHQGQAARSINIEAFIDEKTQENAARPTIEPQLKDWRARVLDDERGTPK